MSSPNQNKSPGQSPSPSNKSNLVMLLGINHQSPIADAVQGFSSPERRISNFSVVPDQENQNLLFPNCKTVQRERNHAQIEQPRHPINDRLFSIELPLETVPYQGLLLTLRRQQRQLFANDEPKNIKFTGSEALGFRTMRDQVELLRNRVRQGQQEVKLSENAMCIGNPSFQATNKMYTARNRLLTYQYLLRKTQNYIQYQLLIRDIDEQIQMKRIEPDSSMSYTQRGDFLIMVQNFSQSQTRKVGQARHIDCSSSRKRRKMQTDRQTDRQRQKMSTDRSKQKDQKIMQLQSQIQKLHNDNKKLQYFLETSEKQKEQRIDQLKKQISNLQGIVRNNQRNNQRNSQQENLIQRSNEQQSMNHSQPNANSFREMKTQQNGQISKNSPLSRQPRTGKNQINQEEIPQQLQLLDEEELNDMIDRNQKKAAQKFQRQIERVQSRINVKERKSKWRIKQIALKSMEKKVVSARDMLLLLQFFAVALEDPDFLLLHKAYEREFNFINFRNDHFGNIANFLKKFILRRIADFHRHYLSLGKLQIQTAEYKKSTSQKITDLQNNLKLEKQKIIVQAQQKAEQQKKQQHLKQIQAFQNSTSDPCTLMLQLVPMNLQQLKDQLKTLSDDDEHYEQKVLEYRKELISNYLKLCTENFKFSIPERIQHLKKQENRILQSLSKRPRQQINAIIQLEDSFYEGLKDIAKLL